MISNTLLISGILSGILKSAKQTHSSGITKILTTTGTLKIKNPYKGAVRNR
jgi:hypothetical protein